MKKTYGILYVEQDNILKNKHIQAESLEDAEQQANELKADEIICVQEI